jgi:hypothetical protein
MAVVTGPLLSIDATGGFARQLIFQNQKGKHVVKRWKAPSNPNSLDQQEARFMTEFFVSAWAGLSLPEKQSWEEQADSLRSSPYHAYLKHNISRWQMRLPGRCTLMALDPPADPGDISGGYAEDTNDWIAYIFYGDLVSNWFYGLVVGNYQNVYDDTWRRFYTLVPPANLTNVGYYHRFFYTIDPWIFQGFDFCMVSRDGEQYVATIY